MTDKTPIETIMATYNEARFLKAKVDPLFKQAYLQWRLVVRDDGSTDDTPLLLKALSDRDKRIHLVKDGLGNLGMNGNFNHLVTLSTAPYVMYCDPDDVWLPEKIELTLNEMLLAEKRDSRAAANAVVSRNWWKSKKASRSGELSHNSHPLGGGCRRMTPRRSIAGAVGKEKARLRI